MPAKLAQLLEKLKREVPMSPKVESILDEMDMAIEGYSEESLPEEPMSEEAIMPEEEPMEFPIEEEPKPKGKKAKPEDEEESMDFEESEFFK